MRLLAFGCPHIQSTITLGSSATVPTFQWLLQMVEEQQVSHVVCLGDTVDSVSKTDLMTNLTVKWVLDAFKELAHSGVAVIWMLGNHDVYSEQHSALDIFDDAPNFTVLRQPRSVLVDGLEFVFWPFQQWMDDHSEWRQRIDSMYVHRSGATPRILCTHTPIEGMPMGGTKDQGADIKELGLQFDLVIAGHYHEASQFLVDALSAQTPIVVPVCVIAHGFKDLGWFHGAVMYDTTTAQTSWLTNPHSHVFYRGTSQQFNEAMQNSQLAMMKDRTHARFTDEVDPAVYREYGLPTVQVRPKQERIQSSGKESFQLDSDPMADLRRWFADAKLDLTDHLAAVAKGYLA